MTTRKSGYVERQVQERLKAADAAARNREWESVLDHASHALVLAPDNEDAQQFRAAALRALQGTDAKPSSQEPRTSSKDLLKTLNQTRTKLSDARRLYHDVLDFGTFAVAALYAAVPLVALASTYVTDYVVRTFLDQEKLAQQQDIFFMLQHPELLLETAPAYIYIIVIFVGTGWLGSNSSRLSRPVLVVSNVLVLAAWLPVYIVGFLAARMLYDERLVVATMLFFVLMFVLYGIRELSDWLKQQRDRSRASALAAETQSLITQAESLLRNAEAAANRGDDDNAEQLMTETAQLLTRIHELQAPSGAPRRIVA